jgi:hypothetical protein
MSVFSVSQHSAENNSRRETAQKQRKNTELSNQQLTILLWLFDCIQKLEKRGDDWARQILGQGIPWQANATHNSRRVSICKSLSRLEQRGLIDRVAPNGRAKAVRLTQLGRFTVQQLKAAKAN